MTKTILSISCCTTRTNTWGDIHTHQFLEQQLARIRNLHLRYLHITPIPSPYAGGILAVVAQVGVVLGDADQTAVVAHTHHVRIGRIEEALAHQLGGAIRDQDITLHLHISKTSSSHFSHTQTAVTGTTFQRLAGGMKEFQHGG